MKKIIYGIVAVIVILNFNGCSTSPSLPKYKISKMDNVGYIIKTNPKMVHTYIGTTMFNNFNNEYPKLVVKKDIEILLQQNINAHLVNLSTYNFKDLNNLISESNNKWTVNNEILYNELIKKYKLKAIIIIEEGSGGIYLYPTYLSSKSSGLLTRSFLKIKSYFAVSGFHFKLSILNPKAVKKINNEIVTAKFIYSSVNSEFQKNSGFIRPKNDESLTIEEQESVKKAILNLTKHNIKIVNKNLINI